MKTQQIILKIKKSNKAKQFILAAVLLVSVGMNIFQVIFYNKTSSEAEDVSWRLNNYRDLQATQINAVRQNCRRINETALEPLGLFSGVLKDYDSSLSNEYATNVKLRCRLPALLIAGHLDFNELSEYDAVIKKIFVPNSYILNEDAFNEVKW